MTAIWNRVHRTRHARATAFALSAALLVAGCASDAGLKPRAVMTDADTLAASRTLDQASADADAWPRPDWWTGLGDAQLDDLMREALAGSPGLRVAQARARQALALAGAARSRLQPSVNAGADSTRERFAAGALIPPPLAGQWGTFSELQATASWDLDLWGGNRAQYDSALGNARAAALDEQQAQLLLSLTVAHAYAQLQRAFLQRDVAQATAAQRQQVYELTRQRNAAGIDSRLELKQAEAALPAAREQVAQWQETIDLTRDALAALIGRGPDRGLSIERPSAAAQPGIRLPARLPAQLLGRRPDVRAQRWRIEAARRAIDAARAQFYPNVDLTALVGFQSLGPSGFLSLANRQIGVGPALSLPLFDGGRRRADLSAADAQFDLLVEQYNQTLSDALREVADQLASWRSVEQQRVEQQQGLDASRQAYDMAVLRYREGLGNYLQVLSTETQLLAQQGLEADLRVRSLELSIDLVGALGGGFAEAAMPMAALAH